MLNTYNVQAMLKVSTCLIVLMQPSSSYNQAWCAFDHVRYKLQRLKCLKCKIKKLSKYNTTILSSVPVKRFILQDKTLKQKKIIPF